MIEIHYSPFKIFKGLLYKKEPLFIFDVPKYIYNKKEIPVILNIKKSDDFPVYIDKISIKLKIKKIEKITEFIINKNISQYHFSEIFYVDLNENNNCVIEIIPKIYYSINKIKKDITLANINGIKKNSLEIHYSPTNYVFTKDFNCLDIHTHSSFTDDFVEFGAKPKDYISMLKYIGLNSFAITDHSYDLDDKEGFYFNPDNNLTKWNKLQEIGAKNNNRTIIGEELSCGNQKNKNIHLLVLKNSKFISGSGDGGEKLCSNKPTISLQEVISKYKNNFILIAAHPFIKSSFFEDLLLNRGVYSNEDLKDLEFIQILNGNKWINYKSDIAWYIKRWQKGVPTYFLAGNDSHGYFSWSPKLLIPLLKASYNSENLFGKHKTILNNFKSSNNDVNSLKKAFRSSSITTGPFMFVKKNQNQYTITAKSYKHFGKFTKLKRISFNEKNILNDEIEINDFEFNKNFEVRDSYNSIFVLFTEKQEICFSNVIN